MTTANFYEIAAPLIDRFKIIPIEPNSKRPLKGIGATHRSNDPAVIQQWAEQFPTANAAIVADENICIVETDDLDKLKAAILNGTGKEIPKTLTACGSSENRPHLYYKHSAKSRNVGNMQVPGLFECRWNNQYCVAPGSIHETGALYRWLNSAEIIPIPDWLVSELARLAITQKAERKNPAVQVESDGQIPEGSRHYFLMSELGRAWNGKISEEELTALALELNERCNPPKDEAHVRQCVRDVMRKSPFDPGPTVVLGSPKTEPDGNVDPDQKFKYPAVPKKMRDYALLPGLTHTKYAGWFARGRVHLIAGASGSGKTTLIVDALVKASRSEPVLGHQGTGLRPLVLFADRGELSNMETLDRMGLTTADIPIDHMPVTMDAHATAAILDRIERNKPLPEVVFIEGADTLVSDANKSHIVAPFVSALQAIAERYHIALILSVGSGKSKPKEGYKLKRERVLGSQVWGRMTDDNLILCHTEDGTEDDRGLDFLHRNARAEKFSLTFEDGKLIEKPAPLEGVAETKEALKPTDVQSQMISIIQALPVGTILSVEDSFPSVGKGTASKNLQKLAAPESGWVGKKNGKWVTLRGNQFPGNQFPERRFPDDPLKVTVLTAVESTVS